MGAGGERSESRHVVRHSTKEKRGRRKPDGERRPRRVASPRSDLSSAASNDGLAHPNIRGQPRQPRLGHAPVDAPPE
eukprot:7227298-Pyramimonas_sp.AAC.1